MFGLEYVVSMGFHESCEFTTESIDEPNIGFMRKS
jgi:hypothetical protein